MANEMTDYAALKLAANVIKNEVEESANSAYRIGTEFLNFIEAVNIDISNIKGNNFFGSLLLEASDVTKLDYANGCIKALYLKKKPNNGHRYVLTYLYHWGSDADFQITIKDYNESDGTETIIVPLQTFTGDTFATIHDTNDNEIGIVYASTEDYAGIVVDAGETANRLPYLMGICYTYNQSLIIKNQFETLEQKDEEQQDEIDRINDTIAPILLDSDDYTESDTIKCDAANAEVKALYLNTQPSSGHRFVLSYLYLQASDNMWFVTISDLTISSGVITAVANSCQVSDKTLGALIDTNGNEIGKIYLDSDYYTLIADQGEGLARMPYLSDSCFDYSTQYKLIISALESTRTTANDAAERVEVLENELFPTLFACTNIAASDIAKCAAANAEVRALYLNVTPAENHRFVFSYLYLQSSDTTWYFSITDYNETDGTSEMIVSSLYAADKTLSVVTDVNGNEIGYIWLDSDYYAIIANQGEGLARMPYLLESCFDYSTQFKLIKAITDERITALESKANTKYITLWGDSITWGSASSTNALCYAALLQTMIANAGYSHVVINCGVGGDNMPTIVGRLGGTALYLTKDITIPASASQSVEIDEVVNYVQVGRYLKAACNTDEQIQLMLQGDLGRSHIDDPNRDERHTCNPVIVNGVECIWSWNPETEGALDAGTYNLAVAETQSNAVTLKAGTPFYTHGAKMKSDIIVLAMGTNGGFSSADDYIKMCDLSIEAANTDNYIVCSPYGGTALSNLGVSGLQTLEAALLARYGGRFFNWRKFMVEDALDIEGLTATTADQTAIAAGECPPQLLADEVHPNDYGHDAIARRLFDMMSALGYFD